MFLHQGIRFHLTVLIQKLKYLQRIFNTEDFRFKKRLTTFKLCDVENKNGIAILKSVQLNLRWLGTNNVLSHNVSS